MDLSHLNPGQKEAVETSAGPLLILAGPGTGKTRVIITKILHLMEQGIAPSEILAVTFSNKATEEMEERLAEAAPETLGRIGVQTMHAFCTDLVQRHGFRLGFEKSPKMMTEVQSQLLFRQIAERLPLQTFLKSSNIDSALGGLMGFIQSAKDQGRWPEDVIRYATTLPEDTDDEKKIKAEWLALADIYNAYQDYCFQSGYFDFGDAILSANRILSDFPIVRKEYHDNLKVILVDEFQDTNWPQVELLKNLASEGCHIAVVGDDDQSIYGFRGASYEAFNFFAEAFPKSKVVELSDTYRLSPAIAATSTALIHKNQHRFKPDKALQSRSDFEEPVFIHQYASFEDEAFDTAEKIEKLIESGVSPNEIGVLIRAHGHGEMFLQEAARRKLPIDTVNPETLFEQPIVKDVLAFLSLILHPDDSIALMRLLDSPFIGLTGKEIYEFCQWKNPSLKNFEKILEAEFDEGLKKKLSIFLSTYQSLVGVAHRLPCSELLMEFYSKSGIVEKLMKEDETSLRILAKFQADIFEWESSQPHKELPAIYSLLQALSEQQIEFEHEENPDTNLKTIKVLSVHSSKGLEFDHVFILSLVGRRFPGNFRKPTWAFPAELSHDAPATKESHIEEERRLLYVGMTRARKYLNLCTVQKKGTRPSRFLIEDLLKAPGLNGKLQLREIPASVDTDRFVKILQQPLSRVQEEPPAKPDLEKSLSLSFTQLDKYDLCPLKYRFSYDLRIPTPSSPALLTGSAVHEALERFYREVQEDKLPSKDDLLRYFDRAYDREAEEHDSGREGDKELAREHLAHYYDLHEGKFTKPVAIEEPFTLKVGPHTVRGKIDRADNSENGYVIIDYKTGKAKSNENKTDQKFAKDSLQFSIYALAAKEALHWNVSELVFYYLYENSSLSTTRDEEDLEKTRSKILEIAKNINERRFEPKEGRHCQWCEYRRICPSID